MQYIYTYIPETNHVSTLCNVAAVLWLQFMAHAMLFPAINGFKFYISTFEVLLLLLLLNNDHQ
jgi:hypothetical protein